MSTNNYQNTTNMVNYTTVLTSSSNEEYTAQTETSDSVAALIKNNVIIDFGFSAEDVEGNEEVLDSKVAAIDLHYIVH